MSSGYFEDKNDNVENIGVLERFNDNYSFNVVY